MKDKFKERVDNTRQEWDHYETNLDDLWGDIELKLDEQENKMHSGWYWMKVAASVSIIIAVGWALGSTFGSGGQKVRLYGLSDMSPELAETEFYYSSQINETLHLISACDVDVDDFVMEDLALLDSAYRELQHDLRDNVDNDEVVSAMIQNYRLKLQILEKILEEISTNDKKDEDTDIIV